MGLASRSRRKAHIVRLPHPVCLAHVLTSQSQAKKDQAGQLASRDAVLGRSMITDVEPIHLVV